MKIEARMILARIEERNVLAKEIFSMIDSKREAIDLQYDEARQQDCRQKMMALATTKWELALLKNDILDHLTAQVDQVDASQSETYPKSHTDAEKELRPSKWVHTQSGQELFGIDICIGGQWSPLEGKSDFLIFETNYERDAILEEYQEFISDQKNV